MGRVFANPNKDLLRSMLLFGASCSSILALSDRADAQDVVEAAAQQAAADDVLEMEAIVVTGSNIRRASFDGPSPIQIVGRPQIESFGAAQFVDITKAIAINTGSEFYSEASQRAGVTQFNLRGLGFSSTLTLVNGRRAGVSPLSDATGAAFTDINQFPLAMVERIEVLKDGASAVYGSEAVSGVVNIITRKGFEGFEVSGGYQDASNEAWNVNLVVGSGFDRGRFNLYATYYDQTGNKRTDFDWLRERIAGDGDPQRSRLLNTGGSPSTYFAAVPNGDGTFRQLPGAVGFADPDCEAAGGVFRRNDDGTLDTRFCRYNFGDQAGIIPWSSRFQGFAEFEYALWDNITFINETSFSHNISQTTRGPASNANGNITNNGSVLVPGDHPFNFFITDPADPARLIYIGPENWDNAIHTGADLSVRFVPFGPERAGDLAPRRRAENNYFRFVNGLDLGLFGDWRGVVTHQYARASFTENEPFNWAADTLNDLVLDGSYNPFGLERTQPDLVSPKDGVSLSANTEQVDQLITTTSVRSARTEQHVVDAVFSGTAFDLPTGPVGLAVGGQYRELDLNETPDSLSAAAEGRRTNRLFVVEGRQTVWSGFAEVNIPFNDLAELQLAVRHEDYGGTIGSTTDPKVAGRITPTDWLTLRGSWGTSFQGPTLRQVAPLFEREFINDPVSATATGFECGGDGTQTNATVRIQGDEDLRPQSSKNLSVGAAVQHRGLRTSVDFWRYNYEDLIAPAIPAQTIVTNDCADDGIPNDPRIIRGGSGNLNQINTSIVNIGSVIASGLDYEIGYDADLGPVGALSLYLQGTYIRKFQVDDGDGTVFDGVGSRNFTNNFAPLPRFRFNAGAIWTRGIHNASIVVRYTDGYDNDQSNDAPIDSFTTVDIQYGISFEGLFGQTVTSLVIGADNVFDEDPPSLDRFDDTGRPIEGIFAVDRPSYDPLAGVDIRGRILYVRALQKF